ncbi:LOW QUALITY PROTEIN: sushi, von Willebrand factor type A, EGF and pentraxin domain-containing protein 1-like [Ostrea edulis]|uniref:LOW QUALITY PROTEIN: sushi, von Willebrand factor type A, EGF and pentraxin domain-containing protein 1-like n=1 Tax=Ostrea edulis TaxID=37623 RepID=UPI0024AEAB94|nr:LOW QUALITY PROTEIN: sushi, von Willebrand factor type A, EGF and pentraxin domain-containing protein 1-like [Ostrea edulis]
MRGLLVNIVLFTILTIFYFVEDQAVDGKEIKNLITYIKEEEPNLHVDTTETLKDSDKSSVHHLVKRGFRLRRAIRRISRWVPKVVSSVGKVFKKTIGFVGKIICIFFCGSSQPPNNPPYFKSCSGPSDHLSPSGQTSVPVSWSAPRATDKEDGQLSAQLVQGGAPGSTFERGSHTIIYKVSDRQGLTAYCYFDFKVSVITCNSIEWPINGFVRCDKPEYVYGSYCSVGCNQGYQMISPATVDPGRVMCDKTVDNKPIFNKVIPTCEAITCPANTSALEPLNGAPVCTHSNHKYDSSCVTQCESGYSLTSGIIFTTCQEDKTWSTDLPDCQDNESPILSNCPTTIYAYTNKNKQSAVVNWTEPTATDNSGSATVSQTRGPARGSDFRLGLTEVRYRATDTTGNNSPECIFFVNVEEIRCDPPLIVDKYLFYQCPDGYSYGATCQLQCMGSFPLIGNDTITCERNDSYVPPRGYWEMGGTEPFCSKNPCDKLPAPENGAMACDTWLFGIQCKMQCSSQYDIPFGTVSSNGAPFTGLFTCSESKGEYSPSNTVPGCTELRRPGRTTVLGDFFYYTGDCNDPTVLEEIKQNFINKMQYLENNGFNGVCPSQIDCNIQNTVVTCGTITGRKKRWTDVFIREKRSTHKIRVEITMETTWFDFNSTGGATFYFLEDIQKSIFNVIKASSVAGDLTVRGLSPDINSFALGWSDPDCPDGHIIRWSTLTCVPCGPGTFLDNSDPLNPGCRDCPLGKYKDIAEDVSCTTCPVGTFTLGTGSRNASDCIEICKPGAFSPTGLEPCHQCPLSTYQEGEMATNCSQCPPGTTTEFSGATGPDNCTRYDIQLKSLDDRYSVDAPSSPQTSISLSVWILAPTNTTSLTLFCSQSANSIINITYDGALFITINSLQVTAGVTLRSHIWSHVTVRIDSSALTLDAFQDGIRLSPKSIASYIAPGESLLDSTSTIYFGINENSINGYVISNYQVQFNFLSDAEVAYLAGGCNTTLYQSYISMDTIINTAISLNSIVIPSLCDNINQCDPNPCNGHPCTDKLNNYTCNCQNGYHGFCSVTCDHGYTFVDGNEPRPFYICGPNTTYNWVDDQPPACGRVKSPRRIRIVSSVSYNPEIPCIDASAVALKMKTQLESSLSCSLNGTCSVKVENPGCMASGRRKRSTSGEQTITLSQTFISGDNLNLEMFYSTNNLSEPLYDLLLGIYELEASALEINSSHSFLQFELNGVNYTSEAVTTSSFVECPDGQGRSEALCADCPMGTYSLSSQCILCPIGTYQDETEQTFCKPCPSGFTTNIEGSKNISDCSVETSTTITSTTNSTDPSPWTSTYTTSDITETGTSQETSAITEQMTTSSHHPVSFSSTTLNTQELDQYTMKVDLLLAAALPVLIVFLVVFSVVSSILIYRKIARQRARSPVARSWASLNMITPHCVQTPPPVFQDPIPSNKKFDKLSISDIY